MNTELFLTLAGAGAAVGALHSLAPDHWIPIAAVGRARAWTPARTARVAAMCAASHVTISVVLGVLALLTGRELFEALGRRLEAVAGLLLIGFGVAYAVWGLRHALAARLHGHRHDHYDHVHGAERGTVGSLVLIYAVDPCVPVIAILMAAAPLPWPAIVALVALYQAVTVAVMMAMSVLAGIGAGAVRARFLAHWGEATAGGLIAGTGVLVAILGI